MNAWRLIVLAMIALSASTARSERPNVFFIHGANVSERDAQAWAAEMFRRLWQAGADMEFHPVAWESDLGASYDYQANVSNAFVTASRLAPLVNAVSGRRVVIAHSLGTMVAAAAIQDYGMQVERLIMLNSAIPSEVFDPSLADLSSAGIPSIDMNSVEMLPNGYALSGRISDFRGRVLHSDIKDVAYFFNHAIFARIVKEGGLK